MKNIHILPTDKPSRLQLQMNGSFHIENGQTVSLRSYQNIYITSDEEIKEGDYYFNLRVNKVLKCNHTNINAVNLFGCKKIILTTSQDLIKDGVQAIDDDFLECFVKNSSCEWVEVKNGVKKLNSDGEEIGFPDMSLYKIIVPKEESLTNDTDSHSWGFENFEVIKTEEDAKIFVETMENIPEPNDKLKKAFEDFKKQETLEEAYNRIYNSIDFTEFCFSSFKIGAKWQAERMYSEEEAYKIWKAGQEYWKTSGSSITFEELIEQFKKK